MHHIIAPFVVLFLIVVFCPRIALGLGAALLFVPRLVMGAGAVFLAIVLMAAAFHP